MKASPYTACGPIDNAEELKGHIALVLRGDCMFAVKARRLQQAGVTGVIFIGEDELRTSGPLRDSFSSSPHSPFQTTVMEVTARRRPSFRWLETATRRKTSPCLWCFCSAARAPCSPPLWRNITTWTCCCCPRRGSWDTVRKIKERKLSCSVTPKTSL